MYVTHALTYMCQLCKTHHLLTTEAATTFVHASARTMMDYGNAICAGQTLSRSNQLLSVLKL